MSAGATHHVRFEPAARELEARHGETIAHAAARAGLMLVSACGGLGICAGCRVTVAGAASAEPSRARLTPAQLARGDRLACSTPIEGDLVVTVPADLGAGARPRRGGARRIEPLGGVATASLGHGPSLGMLVLAGERDLAVQVVELRHGRVLFELREPAPPAEPWEGLASTARAALVSHGFAAEQVHVALVLSDRTGGRFEPSAGAEELREVGGGWRRAAEVGFPARSEAPVVSLAAASTGPGFVALGALAAFHHGAHGYVQLGVDPARGGRDALWLVAARGERWSASEVEAPTEWGAAARDALVRGVFGREGEGVVLVGTDAAEPSAADRALLGAWLEELPARRVRFLGDGRLAGLHALLTSHAARAAWTSHDPILHVDAVTRVAPPTAERVLSSE